eukprot:9376606-Lingulodinium_polyedra.AAC.2
MAFPDLPPCSGLFPSPSALAGGSHAFTSSRTRSSIRCWARFGCLARACGGGARRGRPASRKFRAATVTKKVRSTPRPR